MSHIYRVLLLSVIIALSAAPVSADVGDIITVSGAGISGVNGTYTGVSPCPRGGGYPYGYMKDTGDYMIFESGNLWWISTWPQSENYYRSCHGSNAQINEPWEVEVTWCLANDGIEPVPTVTYGDPPPAFSKTFVPNTITPGVVSVLTFTIDNTASTSAATAIDFTDVLPAGIVIANPPNAATTCTGGTLTAVSGMGTISYTGGSVSTGATCTISVDVTGTTPGPFVNTTGDLTSSSGNSGTASDTLTIEILPPASIPTLSEWGMIIMSLMLAGSAFWMIRRRIS